MNFAGAAEALFVVQTDCEPVGIWGTALYSDDLAADVRDEFRDLVSGGHSSCKALERLVSEYASTLADPDEAPVFWLAVADTAWRPGRPQSRATAEALRVIEIGADLHRWNNEKERRKRRAVLNELAERLRTPAPAPKRLRKRLLTANEWNVGEVVAYRLASGAWALFRVIGHHEDKGGRSAICEPLDWTGKTIPDAGAIAKLTVRGATSPLYGSQFIVGEPRRRADAERLVRTGHHSPPTQQPEAPLVFVFPYIDRYLDEVFGLA